MGYETIRLQKPFTIDEIVSIHYFEYTSTYAFEGEQHDFWEFLYVDKGEVSVRADETDHTLRKGQIIFHKPGEFHSLRAGGGTAPNLVVVGFVCKSPAMRFFEDRVESLGDVGRDLLATIVAEAQDAFSSNLGDPQMLRLERREDPPFGGEQLIAAALEELLESRKSWLYDGDGKPILPVEGVQKNALAIAPIIASGDIAGSAPLTIIGPKGVLTIPEGCIIANRHIHMTPADAAARGLKDGDYVDVVTGGERRTRFYDVQIRVSDKFRLEMHIDTDDANAAGIGQGAIVHIAKKDHECKCGGGGECKCGKHKH